MALLVDGRGEALTRARWVDLGAALSVPSAAVTNTIDEVVAVVDRWLPGLETIGFDQRRTHKLRRGIEYRRNELAA
jgi:hypothetical protein